MGSYPNAKEGIGKIYTAAILGLVAACVAIIPVIGTIGGGVLSIIAIVFTLMGLSKASADEEQYKKVLTLQIVVLVVSALGVIPAISTYVGIVTPIASLVAGIMLINVTVGLCENIGANDIAAQGNKARKLLIAETILEVIVAIVGVVTLATAQATITSGSVAAAGTALGAGVVTLLCGIAVLVVTIIYYVVYLKFLKGARDAF